MIARLVNSPGWQLLPTWGWELSSVSLVVVGVARLTGGGLVEALTALAVLLTFAHVQVATRLEEADAARPLPAVHCRAMLDRYLVATHLPRVPEAPVILPLLLVFGCAARVPPHLFPDPIPEPRSPEPIPYVVDAQDCPEEVALVAGELAPHVDAEGQATCHAAIVPGARYTELLLAEREAVFWRDMARSQRLERERDQRECQAKHDQVWIAADDAQAQLRAARLSALLGVAATAGACAALR